MHGIPRTPFSALSSTSHTLLPLPLFEIIVKSSATTCSYSHGIGFKLFLRTPHSQSLCNSYSRTRKKNRGKAALFRASLKETPYDVLGVSPSATPNEIKRAYRKLALKFHPDVNKEANAQEKFMRIKHAYSTLVNPESKRKYDFRSHTSNYSTSGRNTSRTTVEEEEFYGFEDFFRDLQTEFQNWEAGAASQGKPKSLWEELADIGEEFVEFLEKELNITDVDVEHNDNQTRKANPYEESGPDARGDDAKNEGKKSSSIEENIDEIEATLARLKKELGL